MGDNSNISKVSDDPSKRYLSLRTDPHSGFGYGLMRRTQMLLSAIDAHAPHTNDLRVVDFGCADGAMLAAAAAHLGGRFSSGLGLDVFRAGIPTGIADNRIEFVTADLFKHYPFPIPDASIDIVIASAFFKHHPEPIKFLREVTRVLKPGGLVVLMDPRPFVVRIGCRIGRFNPEYNPNIWSLNTIAGFLQQNSLGLKVNSFKRYWIAPTAASYSWGIEKLIPDFIGQSIALHQCLTMFKIDVVQS